MTSKERHQAVAIVGIAAQLPSSELHNDNLDYHSFWDYLTEKRDAYGPVPAERLEGLTPGFSVNGAFLKNIAKFDNVEFGIGIKDAKSMLMSTRRLLELSFLAALDSGTQYRGRSFGSFMCGTGTEHFDENTFADRTVDTPANALANRVSYFLDITGPSLFLDTACSSSLTAMHLALKAIQSGECEGAFVGGCQLNTNLFDWTLYSEGKITSPEYKCKPFDANANGFTQGEGAVVVVLKPLEAALKDNDHIYSVVLGSAINSNGGRASLHAPSAIGQQECILAAFAQAGRSPDEVDFVELHATGTAVGDPIEANAAGEIFSRKEEVIIGSVKGNIGHLESTAFLASLAKVCLMLEHKAIPPNMHFNERNPQIKWDKYQLRVPTEQIPLEARSSSGRSLIAMASSGIGGSNGHIVIEGSPLLSYDTTQLLPEAPVLFIVGGLTPKAVQSLSDSVLQLLSSDSSSAALSQAVTLARRARDLPWRTHFIFNSVAKSLPTIPPPVLVPKSSPPVVLVFTGQGPQHVNMGRSLFRSHQVFRDSILEMDKVYEANRGESFIKKTGLFDGREASITGAWPIELTLPALAMVQIALFDLLSSLGIHPTAILGHSAGETAMMYASGACSKAMAVELTIARADGLKVTETVGAGMAALGCNLETAISIVKRAKETFTGTLEIACHNSPEAYVISGDWWLLDAAVALAQKEDVFARKVNTKVPAHSSMMEICKDAYMKGIEDVFSRYPQRCVPAITTFSTVSGQPSLVSEFTPDYWWQNLRSQVHFTQTIAMALERYPEAAFIEMSPHPTLSSYVSAAGQSDVVCPMKRAKSGSTSDPETLAFTDAIGTLSRLGISSFDLTSLYGRASRNKQYDIPYPFTLRDFPMRIDGPRINASSRPEVSALCLKMNAQTHPDLAQHIINGEKVVPASALVDMVLQSGARVLWNVEFNSIFSLESEMAFEARIMLQNDEWTLVTSQENDLKTHSKGSCNSTQMPPPPSLNLEALRLRLPPVELEDFYTALLPLTNYGPIFRRVKSLAGDHEEVLAEIDASIESHGEATYLFNPVILDACYHFILHPKIAQSAAKDTVLLPKSLGRFIYYSQPKSEGSVFSHLRLVEWTPETRTYNLDVYDNCGIPLCSLHRLEFRELSNSAPAIVKKRFDLVQQPLLISGELKTLDEQMKIYDVEENALHRYLDTLARQIIVNSLTANPTASNEIHCQRYLAFSQQVATRQLGYIPSSEQIAHMRSHFSEYFEITERLGDIHLEAFNSSTAVVEVLFRDDVMSRFYGKSFGPLLEYATRAFEKIISAMAGMGKRALKILEAGAGTGVLTRYFSGALKQREDVVAEYFVTDVSFALASLAAKSCSYPHAIAKTYDLSKSVKEQGFLPGSLDIVTAFHVLHATSNISETLASLYELLAPGGCLLVIELDGDGWEQKAGSVWHDFVFGCFAEWYGFTDDREKHCSMSPNEWQSALHAAGFVNFQYAAEAKGSLSFTFTAQKSHVVPVHAISNLPNYYFFSYKYGEEASLKKHLEQLDIEQSLTLWILASEGRDGDAAASMLPTLAKELSQWDLHLAVFSVNLSAESDRTLAVLKYRDYLAVDQVIHFDEAGNPFVTKVVPSLPPPARHAAFDPAASWISNGVTVWQNQVDALGENQVLVDVLAWSESQCSWRGFVGTVISSRFPGLDLGSQVAGIITAQLSNHVVCDAETLTQITESEFLPSLAEDALAMVIGFSALGTTRAANAVRSIQGTRVLIPESTELGKSLVTFFAHSTISLQVTTTPPHNEERFNLIFLDSSNVNTHLHLKSWLEHKSGELFVWNTWLKEEYEKRPWNIGYALRTAMKLGTVTVISDDKVIRPSDLVRTLPATAELPLFRPNKAYIILGGASDLGAFMALWMYKNGARHIVLTSRRGLSFFEESAKVSTKKLLRYLQSRPGVKIRVEAFDATSTEAMFSLSKSITAPVGGCFIATLILMDGLFMNQTPEKFATVADLKLKVFEAFESAFNVAELDFVVSLSSMMSVVGNLGQSSYAAGCGLLDGKLSRYLNAFSIMLPGISHLGYLDRIQSDGAHKYLERWTLSPDEMCEAIGDGILKLAAGDRCSFYIPDLAWEFAETDMGLPPSCRHLVPRNIPNESQGPVDIETAESDRKRILATILNLLDVEEADFSPVRPFTSFGLDSLGATRISQVLRPYVNVSQMQVLGGLTWEKLEQRIEQTQEVTRESVAPLEAIAVK